MATPYILNPLQKIWKLFLSYREHNYEKKNLVTGITRTIMYMGHENNWIIWALKS